MLALSSYYLRRVRKSRANVFLGQVVRLTQAFNRVAARHVPYQLLHRDTRPFDHRPAALNRRVDVDPRPPVELFLVHVSHYRTQA